MLQELKDLDSPEDKKKVRFSQFTPRKNRRNKIQVHEHSLSTEKMKIPRSLVLHRKNKSNEYTTITRFDLPSVKDILARILSSSSSPNKSRTESRNEDLLKLLPTNINSYSPSKVAILKKKRSFQTKNHFRSPSPLKAYNDRIFKLKRLIGK